MNDNVKPTTKALDVVIKDLQDTHGGKTIVNYMPLTTTILCIAKTSITPMELAMCNDIVDVIAKVKPGMGGHMPSVVLTVVSVPANCDVVSIGDLLDIKSSQMMAYKGFIHGSINYTEWLAKFKDRNKVLHAAVGHAKQNVKSKTVTIDKLNFTDADRDNAYNLNDLIEIEFYMATELHNVAGVFINPQLID